MDNYDNFFDGVNGGNRPDTPVYHTPDNGGNGDRKLTPVIILFIVIALIMCLTVIINVVVLAVLKDDIANKYAQSLSESIRSEYDQAILDYIKENGITEDILNSIKEDILNQSTTTAAEYAGKNTIKSVAEIKAVNTKSFTNVSGAISTGFLISDPTSTDDTRYLVTNAHSVLYVASSRSMGVYDTITCTFPGDSTTYTLTPVYIGAYLATTETSGIMGETTTVVRDPDYDYTSNPTLPYSVSRVPILLSKRTPLSLLRRPTMRPTAPTLRLSAIPTDLWSHRVVSPNLPIRLPTGATATSTPPTRQSTAVIRAVRWSTATAR